jgi:hypothetical protein
MDMLTAVAALLLLQGQDKPEPPQEPTKVVSIAKSNLTFYGFVRLDLLYDTDRPNNVQVPSFILSKDTPPGGEKDLSIHPRLTRFGFDLDGPVIADLGDAKLTGKMEVDFYNLLPGAGVITSNSREFLRMRHAYLKLAWDQWSVLAGQREDVISPLAPTPNNDLVMWNAGNLADRRPQVRVEFKSGGITATGMIGLTGAVDGRDLDANGFLDGEESGTPTIQFRVGYEMEGFAEKTRIVAGLWAHTATEEPDSAVGGEDSFDSNAFGIDLSLPITDQLLVRLEAWSGKNLDDVRGGIGQGVVAGDEVAARGGWIEIAYKATKSWTPTLGVYMDDPDDDDLAASGAPDKNFIIALANRFRFGPMEFGADVLSWETEFTGSVDEGKDLRFNFFAAYHF